ASVVVAAAVVAGRGQEQTVSAFFDSFTAEWMRRQPSASTFSGYFGGEVQSALDRQLTPETAEHLRETSALARRGLAELARLDRERMSDAERLSADVMQW